MKVLLILVVCIAAASAAASNLENFESYQKHFNKVYRLVLSLSNLLNLGEFFCHLAFTI